VNEPVKRALVGTAHPALLDSRLRGNDGERCPPEADRGSGCPRVSFSPPKIEDPPQEEWGTKGVEQANVMTMQQDAARSLRVSLNSPLFLSPKIEDPPQEEWGTKGVDRTLYTAITRKRVVSLILI
jgi:hypothetical protein